MPNPSELHRQQQERLLSIHEANYEVFMRRYNNNGERDRDYCRELLRNATHSQFEIRRIKNGLAIDEALDRLEKQG